ICSIQRGEPAVRIAPENNSSSGYKQRAGPVRPPLVRPRGLTTLETDRLDASHQPRVFRRMAEVKPSAAKVLAFERLLFHGPVIHAHIVQRKEEHLRTRIKCRRHPELPAVKGWAYKVLLFQFFRDQALVGGYVAAYRIDALDHVLVSRFARPEKLARAPVERPDDARLADRHERLPHLVARVDVHQNLFEDVVQIPVVAGKKLAVPDDLARINVKSQG